MDVSDEVMKGRQLWFWRRTTLQAVLAGFMFILGKLVILASAATMTWAAGTVMIVLALCITFLLSIYFAAVDNADRLSQLVHNIGEAVGDARDANTGAS